MSGVTVTLLNGAGTTVATTTSSATGAYSFTNVAPGTYQVKVTTPAGYVITTKDAAADTLDSDIDSNGLTPLKTYVSGDVDSSVDAGFWKAASLGDKVWVDSNGNGVQDSGEAGLAGVTVNLLQGGSVISTQTTGAGGAYSFTPLPPGSYSVQVVAPSGYALTLANRGLDTADSDVDAVTGLSGAYTLAEGQADLTADAGLYQPVTIGDRAFEDVNGNGIQDAGEAGVDGVTVKITNTLTGESVTQLTQGGGLYSFTGLRPGNWQETFTAPSGWVLTQAGRGTAATDSDPNPATGLGTAFDIVSGATDATHDVGLYRPITLGDKVFLDANANGIQDAGDGVIAGVTVNLLGSDNLPVAGRSTTSAADGTYSFTGLAPGKYGVQFVLPSGYVASPTGAGTAATDSDADRTTGKTALKTYVSGDTDTTLDAGFYKTVTIGDRVFYDFNGNGRDDGEAGIAGVTVTLLGSGGAITSTTTSSTGAYGFSGLTPGSYRIQVTTPSGSTITARDAVA
ncbi:MAG: SdrD B-like domain-containing protein, partial [Paracraurococcus sp.]